ncbi:MAG TPA: helix-hairpin-helix domain-containing protein, partial [Longimicrobiaceae bacterium]|nr:helix-hairpin-helix domain-containing protein [Longimicrobiaceae bacterium]
MTPEERLALIVIAVLIAGGAMGRYVVDRADAAHPLQFTSAAADTLSAESGRPLRERVADEVARNRIRSMPLAEGERIDPNIAPAEQLDRLPGVGPAIADRIVEHRRANGPFRSLDELGQVRGIGPAGLERIE